MKTNVELGKDTTIERLRQDGFKAFFLGIGAQECKVLDVEGEGLEGVHPGLDFLDRINSGDAMTFGKRVAVIGGGNVAFDAVRTARRMGGDEAFIVYRRTEEEMPANKEEISEAKAEKISFQTLTQPIRFLGQNGRVAKIQCVKMKLGEADESGRRTPEPIPGSEFEIDVDAVITALGQETDWACLTEECRLPANGLGDHAGTVVGYGCMPDDKCFCHSLGTSNADDGFDLFLNPLDGRFLVTVASARGDDIVRANPPLSAPATRRNVSEYLDRLKRRAGAFTLSMNVADLPYVLELKKDDPVWEELGRKCLCCGSCSMVCPTCACFNVRDEIPEEGVARRVRTWDACLYREYALVAGGHNFRDTRADRVKNRYYHKQEAFVREFGKPSCVGCGRFIENCPTGINVVEVFNLVRGEL